MFFFNWLVSRTVRRASDMSRHVHKLVRAQEDLLSAEAIRNVTVANDSLRQLVREGSVPKARVEEQMKKVEEVANAHLKPYPHAVWRENVEVLLVAIAVAMAVRTFFLQPFKIPTGSMQPTLYGILSDNLKEQDDFKIPSGLSRFNEWVHGASYVHLKSKVDGALEEVLPPKKVLIFNLYQRLRVGDTWHTIWFPPDYGNMTLQSRAEIMAGQEFKKGEDIVKLKVVSGDHLFVNRLSFNFRHPRRGDIVVFETKGIDGLQGDQFYIKRLIATGGERVSIGDDQHVVINGERLTAATPGFENVYTFGKEFQENGYNGHHNRDSGQRIDPSLSLGDLFRNGKDVVTVPENQYLVFGDNTLRSYDSRAWGSFNRTNVIGNSFFVYWPLSTRFGWATR